MNDTTLRFSRTSLRRTDAAYGAAIERFPARQPLVFRLINLVYVLAIFVLIACVTVWGGA